MSTHLADEQIVEYLDGTLSTGDEQLASSHLGGCDDCRSRLADLAQFDGFVQSHQLVDEVATAAMFEVSERVLASRDPRRRSGFGFGGFVTMLAAALLLVAGSLWTLSGPGGENLGLRITRYVPDGAMRSAPPERFHFDLDLAAPGFVAAFARFADGKVEQLLPAGLRSPIGGAALRGEVRLPQNELLDWEYPADHLPREVLVMVFATEPDEAVLAEVRVAFGSQVPEVLAKLMAAPGCRAQVMSFPGR